MVNARQSSLSWPNHIRNWVKTDGRNMIYVTYEDLTASPVKSLSIALSSLVGEKVDESRVKEIVDRHKFSKVTGRLQGHEDRKAFARKGAVGDWVDAFSSEAVEVFTYFCGDTLITLGYEESMIWSKGQHGKTRAGEDVGLSE